MGTPPTLASCFAPSDKQIHILVVRGKGVAGSIATFGGCTSVLVGVGVENQSHTRCLVTLVWNLTKEPDWTSNGTRLLVSGIVTRNRRCQQFLGKLIQSTDKCVILSISPPSPYLSTVRVRVPTNCCACGGARGNELGLECFGLNFLLPSLIDDAEAWL